MQTLLRLWSLIEKCSWREAVTAEWRYFFGKYFEQIEPYLKPTGTQAMGYPCPNPSGDHCPRNVFERDGGFVAVCGNLPQECEPLVLKKTDLAVYALNREEALGPLIESVCQHEILDPVDLESVDGFLPIGILKRKFGSVLVLLARSDNQRYGTAFQLCHRAKTNGVAVLVEDTRRYRQDQLVDDKIVELVIRDPSDLALWRVLRMLWPESWANRVDTMAIFEEVHLELASDPERHIVRLNGEELPGFAQSDLKFARLIRLAAARKTDPKIEEGGWLKKTSLQLDEKENNLTDLRDAFASDQADGFANLTVAERQALLQTGRSGYVRLPLHPKHIHFDESFCNLRLLSVQPKPSVKQRCSTKGSEDLKQNLALSRERVLRMLKDARDLGVPLPRDTKLCDGYCQGSTSGISSEELTA